MDSESKSERVNIKSSITRNVEQTLNYNTINSRFSLRSNSLETVYAFDNPSFLPDGLPSSLGSEFSIPPLPNIADINSYDPYDFAKEHNATTFRGTIFHILLISAGPAIFTVPSYFQNINPILGFIGAFFIFCLYAYNINNFTKVEYELCKIKRIPNLSYPDTVYYAFQNGPASFKNWASTCRYITYIVFIILWLSGNAFNLILIGENFQRVYASWYDENIDIRLAILYLIIPLLLLCWIPNLKYLEIFSMIAGILNFCIIVTTIYYVFNDHSPFRPPTTPETLNAIPLFIGSIFFCVNATGILMPLKNDMGNPKKFSGLFGALSLSYLPSGLLYAVFGTLCAQKYGNSLKDNVILNLPQNDFVTRVVLPIFILVVCCQFPLISYVVYDVIWNNILKEKIAYSKNLFLAEYGIRTLLVLIVLIMAYTVPNISMFVSISGTIGTSIDSLIFPALVSTLIHLRKQKNEKKFDSLLFINIVVVVIAIVLILLGLKDCFSHI